MAASSYGGPENLPKLRVTPRTTWPPLKRGMEYAMEQWRTVLGIQNVEFKDRPQNFGSDEAKVNVSRDDVAARFPDPAVYVFKGTHSTGPITKWFNDESLQERKDRHVAGRGNDGGTISSEALCPCT